MSATQRAKPDFSAAMRMAADAFRANMTGRPLKLPASAARRWCRALELAHIARSGWMRSQRAAAERSWKARSTAVSVLLCNPPAIAALQHKRSGRHWMNHNVVEIRPRVERPAATPLAEGKAGSSMMWSMEGGGVGKSATALVEAVVLTNLQALQELLCADNPKDLLLLQQRFARDYIAALMRGTLALVGAIEGNSRSRTD